MDGAQYNQHLPKEGIKMNQIIKFRSKSFHQNSGFTLLELLFTCTILSLMMLFASGSLDIINTKRLNNLTTELYQMIQLARTLALQNKKFVIICPTVDMKTCTENWQSSALAFIDRNGNKLMDKDESPITIVSTAQDFATFRWVAFGNKTNLSFSNEGYTDNQNGRFYICRKDASMQRQILVHKSGRPRIAAPAELKSGYCTN